MKNLLHKLALSLLLSGAIFTNTTQAQGWTFPYPTTGAPCVGCAPAGWTIIVDSPDISSLTDWISYPHYGPLGPISPVPEPTPGVTTFLSAMSYGGSGEIVETTFTMATAEVLTVYFGGFGTSAAGDGPLGAAAGVTENLLVNGVSVSVPIPWDGGWHAVTYDLVVGLNTIRLDPSLGDDDTRHAVHISIPTDQSSDCEDDLVTVISDTEVCLGEDLTLEATSISGGTIVWNLGVVNGVPFTPAAAGTLTYTATSDVDTDCPFSVAITVNSLPVINAGPDQTICAGDDVTLTASGAGVGGAYAWTGGVVNGITFSPMATAGYTVTGTDANGCVNTDNVTVNVDPFPNSNFVGDVLAGCIPHTVNFDPAAPGLTYDWSFGDGGTSSIANPSHTYSTEGLFDVTLTVTSAAGCESTTMIADYITVVPQPVAAFSFVTLDVTQGVPAAQFENNSLYADSYTWDFGDGSALSEEENPTHTYSGINEVGYLVELTATNSYGCEDKVSQLVKMKELLIYYIPNTFTPDGDNFNETFQPVFVSGFDPYDFHLTIFNRWGELVFETYDASKGWNGTYGDKGIVADGAYIWKLEFGDPTNDKRFYEEGLVTIIR